MHAQARGYVIGAGVHLYTYITEKPFTSRMKKGDVGMVKRFSKKVQKQGKSFQLPANQKLCQDRLMLHPYITASRTIVSVYSRAQASRVM